MDYPAPDPKPPLPCPWEVCKAVLAPVAHLVRPGSTEMVWVYPIHEVVGPSAWFGRCLTSQFQIIYTDDGGYTLTGYARQWLRDRSAIYLNEATARAIKESLTRPGREPLTMPEIIAEIYRDGTGVNAFIGAFVHGADRREPPATDDYFPGRPADAPEPGVGEPPAQRVDIDTGQSLGKAAMENSHATTKGLAMLARNQMGLTQDLLARITAALEEAELLAVAAESQVRSVQGLVVACVGTGAGASSSGERMAEQTALGVDTLSNDTNSVLIAVRLAKSRVESAYEQMASAAEHAAAYIATLS